MSREKKEGARFISFEGIDGSGKSTLLIQLSEWLKDAGIPYLKTREPGGTPVGEALRTVLLNPSYSEMHLWTEVFLYAASRAQHVHEVILPALKQGRWVLTDRYADATLAYQGYGRGLDLQRLRFLHEWSTGNIRPHCTVLLDCDVREAAARRNQRREAPDRLEQQEMAFHKRIRNGYLKLAASEPDRFLVLDASRPLRQVLEDFRNLFGRRFPDLLGFEVFNIRNGITSSWP